MRRHISPNVGSTIVNIIPVEQGGTNTDNASSALALFDGIPANTINQPGGVLGLDANGKILIENLPISNISTIAVEGPSSVVKGSVTEYAINNFDAFTTYTVSAIIGTVALMDEKIVYTAPSALGTAGFVLNGRSFNIAVTDFKPVTPVLAAVDGPGGPAAILATSSTFIMQGNNDTHLNSDWQIATDANFTAVVASSLSDTVNKLVWQTISLPLGTAYFVRMRHRSTSGLLSDWSNVVSVVTKTNYIVNKEEAKLVASDKAASDFFGGTVSMSDDGTRVVVSAVNADAGAVDTGASYVFVRSGTTWTQEAKLVASDKAAGDTIRYAVISPDGTRIAMGSHTADVSGVTDAGAVYVFVRSGTSWLQEAKLSASDKATSDYFGYALSFNQDGSTLVVSAYCADAGPVNAGAVYVFTRTNTVWTQNAKLVANDRATNDYFGISVAISADGSRCVIGAYAADVSGIADAGAAYVFTKTVSTWVQEAKLVTNDKATSDFHAMSVGIDSTGSRIILGSQLADATDTGAAYIFSRSGTIWTQEAKLLAADKAANAYFGTSVCLNSDSTRAYIGAYNETNTTSTDGKGAVYIFKRSGTIWSQEIKLTASDKAAGDRFGVSVSTDKSGTRLAIGASLSDPSAIASAGAAYIFST